MVGHGKCWAVKDRLEVKRVQVRSGVPLGAVMLRIRRGEVEDHSTYHCEGDQRRRASIDTGRSR